jgi:hypothetical protein
MKYEYLELEAFPPKPELIMLQNAVGDVMGLVYVKQIDDQDIAKGNIPLAYDDYMELWLWVCSTYDKKITHRVKHKIVVYATAVWLPHKVPRIPLKMLWKTFFFLHTWLHVYQPHCQEIVNMFFLPIKPLKMVKQAKHMKVILHQVQSKLDI